MTTKIESFSGEHGFLSNFCDSLVFLDDEAYRSVEHAFQAAKCARMEDRAPFKYGGTLMPTFWGVSGGVGLNQLGHLLMERRAKLRESRALEAGAG